MARERFGTPGAKQLVIYHADCADGFAAALVAWLKFGDDAEYVAAHYGDEPPEIGVRDVLIVDFSYSREALLRMEKVAASIRVIDHHRTARAIADLSFVVLDESHSGAYLTWRYLHPNEPVPELIRYVEDRDLWKWELLNSHAVSLALRTIPRTFAAWSVHLHDVGVLCIDGVPMLEFQKSIVAGIVRAAGMITIDGHRVPFVNASSFISEVGHALCDAHPESPFSATYFDRADGTRVWSLRSVGDFDVSEVARARGGGGHRNAAGFQEPMHVSLAGGALRIARERKRQVDVEGYDAAHDDAHVAGELVTVARILLRAVELGSVIEDDAWGLAEKHQDPIRRLEIAGALVAAEIDRRVRAAPWRASGG